MKSNPILIVEDDYDIRTTLAELLLMYGHEVHLAKHGKDALEKLSEIPVPSLIFVDAMMPVMDGPTFYRELQKLHSHVEVPVVIFSAIDPMNIPGLAATLRKPADMSDILAVVAKYCRS